MNKATAGTAASAASVFLTISIRSYTMVICQTFICTYAVIASCRQTDRPGQGKRGTKVTYYHFRFPFFCGRLPNSLRARHTRTSDAKTQFACTAKQSPASQWLACPCHNTRAKHCLKITYYIGFPKTQRCDMHHA